MSPRYLLVVGDDALTSGPIFDRPSDRANLQRVYSNAKITAFANSACRCVEVGEAGCILGWLFDQNGREQQLDRLDSSDTAAVIASRGQDLLHSFWGGYVAALSGANWLRILREPSGALPCYYTSIAGYLVFASDAELLVDCEASTNVDLIEIGRQLYRALVPASSTALRGIRELLAGFCLAGPAPGMHQQACWTPWDYIPDDHDCAGRASEQLTVLVANCVRAWASTSRRILLSISGGLDSSIVAACLAKASVETVCLTMFTDDPSGDERAFARILCNKLGLPLIERPYRIEDIDIVRPMAAHLPRPRDRTQALAFEHTNLEVAAAVGADAFMTGNGGDNVFCYSQSAAAVADLYLRQGLAKSTLTALFDVCRLTGCNVLDAFSQAWRLARQAPDYRVRPNPLFLHPDFNASINTQALHHEWLVAPSQALPGKAAHIATILRVQSCIEADRGKALPVFNPLLSQPIVEACIRIPSWQWQSGGRDRSLARRAFRRELPSSILDRKVKGTPGRFAAHLLDYFRKPIRERLLDGKLASQGIIDAVALESVLDGDAPVPDLQRVRILELLNAEAWIDHWLRRLCGHKSN